MRKIVCATAGVIGSGAAYLLGGFDSTLTSLLLFMAADYITGIIVAGVFHKSNKTDSGSLKSVAGFKGLAKKCTILLFVMLAHRLDMETGENMFRDGVCFAFMANELISIVENAGLMGIKLPAIVERGIDILTQKGETIK